MVRRRLPALVNDAQHEPRAYGPLIRRTDSRDYVVAPLVASRRWSGLLHADRKRGRRRCHLDRDLLRMFADGVGVIYERAFSTNGPSNSGVVSPRCATRRPVRMTQLGEGPRLAWTPLPAPCPDVLQLQTISGSGREPRVEPVVPVDRSGARSSGPVGQRCHQRPTGRSADGRREHREITRQTHSAQTRRRQSCRCDRVLPPRDPTRRTAIAMSVSLANDGTRASRCGRRPNGGRNEIELVDRLRLSAKRRRRPRHRADPSRRRMGCSVAGGGMISTLTHACIEQLRRPRKRDSQSARVVTSILSLQQLAMDWYLHDTAMRGQRLADCAAGLSRLRGLPSSAALIDSACEELVLRCGFHRAVLSKVESRSWKPLILHDRAISTASPGSANGSVSGFR